MAIVWLKKVYDRFTLC